MDKAQLHEKYFLFDRLNNDRVQSLYTKRPLDFDFKPGEEALWEQLYEEIREDFGADFRRVARCRPQNHTDIVKIVDGCPADGDSTVWFYPTSDGLLTNLPGVALEIRTADCQSIFLYDPVRRVIGNVHSGWKGTVQQIVTKAVRKMAAHYGCMPADIEAYINPSILSCCFEVEGDVERQFRASLEGTDGGKAAGGQTLDPDRYIRKDRIVDGRQKYYIDTAAINRDRLILEGLRPDRVFLSGVCTKCRHEEYHSFRGDGKASGRNGSLIWLR